MSVNSETPRHHEMASCCKQLDTLIRANRSQEYWVEMATFRDGNQDMHKFRIMRLKPHLAADRRDKIHTSREIVGRVLHRYQMQLRTWSIDNGTTTSYGGYFDDLSSAGLSEPTPYPATEEAGYLKTFEDCESVWTVLSNFGKRPK